MSAVIRNRVSNALIVAIFMLSSAQRLTPVAGAYLNLPQAAPAAVEAAPPAANAQNVGVQQMSRRPPPMPWRELFVRNEDIYDAQLRKYKQQQQQQQPEQEQQLVTNYLNRWPGLRDLLLTTEFDENTLESNEPINERLMERLRQLGDSVGAADLLDVPNEEMYANELGQDILGLTAMPTKKFGSSSYLGAKLSAAVKDHGTKKNVQYMSPCHFKICNMGRKRNAGSNVQY